MNIKCPNCGRSYRSIIAGENVLNLTIDNVSEVCPYCNNSNFIQDGNYNIDQYGKASLIQKLSELNLSNSELDRLENIINTTTIHNSAFDEFKKQINEVSPSILSILSDYFKDNYTFLSLLTLLIFVIPALKKQNENPINVNPVSLDSTNQKNVNISKKDSDEINTSKIVSKADIEMHEARMAKREYLKNLQRKK